EGRAEKIGAAIAERSWGSWATLYAAERNGGFAWGNNRGIERGPAARYVLLLNSDTIVQPGWLPACIKAMDGDPKAGVMICRFHNTDGTIQNVCRRFPTPMRIFLGALGLPWKLPGLFEWADTEDAHW